MTRRRNSAQPVIKETFTLYTPESVEAGDAAERGWIDEEGVDMTPDEYDVEEGVTAVDKAVKHLRSEGALESSSSSFHPGIGYASMHDADMRTGEQEEHHFHLHGFSPEEEHSIFQQMTARRRFNPRPQRLRRGTTGMSPPDKHQLKILIDTVKNPLKGMFLGGPSAQEAEVMLREKFHYTDEEIKEMRAARSNPSLKARKVNPSFMQPQVFRGDVLVVDTDEGTNYIPGDDARNLMVATRNSSPEEVNTAVAQFLGMDDGSVSDVSIAKGKWLARSSAPGYMDATDYSMFDSEQEAWSYLIDMDPSLFIWTVELTASDDEGGTAHIYMASDAAAKAMKEAVQSIDGSNLERDGDFVYVALSGNGEVVMDELANMGFSTEEG